MPCILDQEKLMLCLAQAIGVQLQPQWAWGVLTLYKLSAAEHFLLDPPQLTSYSFSTRTTLQGLQKTLAWATGMAVLSQRTTVIPNICIAKVKDVIIQGLIWIGKNEKTHTTLHLFLISTCLKIFERWHEKLNEAFYYFPASAGPPLESIKPSILKCSLRG